MEWTTEQLDAELCVLITAKKLEEQAKKIRIMQEEKITNFVSFDKEEGSETFKGIKRVVKLTAKIKRTIIEKSWNALSKKTPKGMSMPEKSKISLDKNALNEIEKEDEAFFNNIIKCLTTKKEKIGVSVSLIEED